MNINAANAASRAHFQPTRVEAPATTEKLKAETSAKATIEAPIEEPIVASSEPSPTKGVLRLMQEGHFKGVADVRLRINFHEEISQLNSASTIAGSQAASESFTTGVSEDVATLVTAVASTEEQTQVASELAAGFEASLSDLLTQASANAEADFATLEIALQGEADNFVSQLQTLLELDPEDTLLIDFSAAFAERLTQFGNSEGSVIDVLPELSQPNGNGVAYAKFLEILQELNQEEPEPILNELQA